MNRQKAFSLGPTGFAADADVLQEALDAIRRHLGMEVAYLSEFVDGRAVFRRVSAPGLEHVIKVGDSQSLEDIYCLHILEGRLPRLIPDTSKEPVARDMPITSAVPIGAHVSIPVRLSDGQTYGMFCCLSPHPNPSLNTRDLETMEMFAELAARIVNRDVDAKQKRETIEQRVRRAIDGAAFDVMYQPIVGLQDMRLRGFEALGRFRGHPKRPPDAWFAEAVEVGLETDLELAVAAKAIRLLDRLTDEFFLSLNVSPATIMDRRLAGVLGARTAGQVVVEITEHAPVADYEAMSAAVSDLRHLGCRLAVDDAGAGYASLRHVVRLAPDIVKLDMSLTRSIDTDPALRALAAALIHFARETGRQIVAEGVETEGERRSLRALGADWAQGFLFGRPMSATDALALAGAGTPIVKAAFC